MLAKTQIVLLPSEYDIWEIIIVLVEIYMSQMTLYKKLNRFSQELYYTEFKS